VPSFERAVEKDSTFVIVAINARILLDVLDGRCDSARARYDAAHRKNHRPSLNGERLFDPSAWGCSDSTAGLSLPTVGPIFTEQRDTVKNSLTDVVRAVLTVKGKVFERGLRKGATAVDRLEMLLAADSVGVYVPDPKLVTTYRALSERVKRTIEKLSSPRERGEAIFRLLHDSVLKKYIEEIPFRDVLATGSYNCASAVALYSLLCEEYGVPIVYFTAPQHILCGVADGSNVITVELTEPKIGFDYNPGGDSLVDHLLSLKIYTPEEVEEIGRDSILRHYTNKRRETGFTAVIATIVLNAMSRNPPFAPPSIASYEHLFTGLMLDRSENVTLLVYFLLRFLELDSVRERIPRDVIALMRYRSNEPVFSIALISAATAGLASTLSPEIRKRYDDAMQTIWACTPAGPEGDSTRQFVQSMYALVLARDAALRSAPDTAFAYLTQYVDYAEGRFVDRVAPIIDDYVALLSDRSMYSQILMVPAVFDSVLAPSLRSYALFSALRGYLESGVLRTIDATSYASKLREYLGVLRSEDYSVQELESFINVLRSKLVFVGRVDLVTNLIDEAEKANVRSALITEMRSLQRTMLANMKRTVDPADLKATMQFFLGSTDGPRTESVPLDGTETKAVLEISGLDPGQVFNIHVTLDEEGFERLTIFSGTFGANESSVDLSFSVPTIRRNSSGKATFTVLANGTVIAERTVRVR
jgi:hypothetical protein